MKDIKFARLPGRQEKRSTSTRLVLLFVHFGDAQLRGSERCLLNLVKGIDPANYEVVFWCNHKTLSELAAPFVAEVRLDDFSPPFGFNYPNSANGTFSDLLHLIKAARTLVRRVRPSLILCNSLAPCQWMIPASLLAGIPLLSYHHTTYLPKSRLLSLVHGASHMVGVSSFTLRNFWNDGFPKQRSSVVYNGVEDLSLHPIEKENLRRELGIGPDEFVITSLSALVEWKKVDLVIDSFRLLSECGDKPTALFIVGDGPCKEQLQKQAKGLRVIFCGWRNDIANVLTASDCVIVAAEREAFGLTVIEAASMSRPVVAARAGGVREIIIDGKNGLFADPGSAQSFASALCRLKDDSELRIQLGCEARANYENKFRVERMVSELTALIDTFSGRVGTFRERTVGRYFRLAYFNARLAMARVMGILQ